MLSFSLSNRMEQGYKKKNFIQAKFDFVDEMLKFGGIDLVQDAEAKVLDVGYVSWKFFLIDNAFFIFSHVYY
jgi:hypothetical protein